MSESNNKNNSDESYHRYVQYRENRHQYKTNQIAFPIAMLIIIALLTKFWKVAIVLALIVVLTPIINYFDNKKMKSQKTTLTEKEGISETMNQTGNMKSTENGFINKNNQRNNGRTDTPGTDNMQWFYDMECLDCGFKYRANGSDIWQRKCPKCQGGRA